MKSPELTRNWHFALLSLAAIIFAVYYGTSHERLSQTTPFGITFQSLSRSGLSSRQSDGGGTKFPYLLRILPIGDSITEGWLSSDKNGYRLYLRNKLIADGNDVDFIGAISEGDNNPDNQHEGYGGKMIAEIEGFVKRDQILPWNPNVILLMAGTNDIWHPPDDVPRSEAPDRLASFIDYILCQNGDAVLFVAAILQMNTGDASIEAYNEQYVKAIPDIVETRYKQGYKIRMVNFFDIVTTDYLRSDDGIHPTDAGYSKLADVWYSAINNIPKEWITQPRDRTSVGFGGSREECKTTGLWWAMQNGGNQIAEGAQDGDDTGIGKDAELWFDPLWPPLNTKAGLGVGHNGSEILYADIDGDGKSDYVWLVPTNGALVAWRNVNGAGAYEPINNAGIIAEGTGTAYGVHLVDLNGDKKVDYVVLRDDGTIQAFLNYGQIDDGEYFWPELKQDKFAPGGTTAHNVIFGDLNGDGRKDILIKRDGGKIDGYIQQGNLLDDSFSWKICEGVVYNSGDDLLMADLDGDGFDDFLSMDENGGLTGWLNTPGGGVCGITWIPIGETNTVAVGGWPRDTIRLADFDGDGKDDYLIVNVDDGSVDAWMNWGVRSNITQMVGRGAGVRLADLDGDGLDDYIMVGPDTSAVAFYNRGQVNGGEYSWPPMNNWNPIANGVLGEIPGAARHQIHFADMNGDGLADYLVVDDKTGALYGYYNNGRQDGGWIEKGKIADGPPVYGGTPGVGVRFGDLDGDGREDYLWLDEEGLMYGYLNRGGHDDDTPGWLPLNSFQPIANGVGHKREYIQLSDLNGDGKVDYLYVHPEQGAVEVWWNGGPSTTDNSWQWIPGGQVADGVGFSGLQVLFGRLTTTGRADYLGINAITGGMTMYQNGCTPGSVLGTTKGGGSASDPTCSPPPEPTRGSDDSNAPILIIPPPFGGEPVPLPGEGNTYTPPGGTTASPTETKGPTTTSDTSTPTPTESQDKENVCNIDTTLGLCLDGTYPVYNVGAGTIECTPIDEVGTKISDCQRDIDAEAAATQKWIEHEKSCCDSDGSNTKRDVGGGSLLSALKQGLRLLGFTEEKRDNIGDGSYCYAPGKDPRNPGTDICYATYTCPDFRWPNICANAKSGIDIRGNTAVLTFHTNTDKKKKAKHDTAHMYNGRYQAGVSRSVDNGKGGWNLHNCQAEEYPWGAANPDRTFSKKATVRLVGDKENGEHGRGYPTWVRNVERQWIAKEKKRGATVPQYQKGDGIVFCVDFTSDFDDYLPEDNPQDNICTYPYGVDFILFNNDQKTDDQGRPYRDYDPWFDIEDKDPQPRKYKYTDHFLRGNQKVTQWSNVRDGDVPVEYNMPRTWCRYPSPGNKSWNKKGQSWDLDDGYSSLDRQDGTTANAICADYPGDLNERDLAWNETEMEQAMETYRRFHQRDLGKRDFTQGFLDPAVYTFMGCFIPPDPDDDEFNPDPCNDPSTDPGNPDCGNTNNYFENQDGDPTDDDDPPPEDPNQITTLPAIHTTATPTSTDGPFPTMTVWPDQPSDVTDSECFEYRQYLPRMFGSDLSSAAASMSASIASVGFGASPTTAPIVVLQDTVVLTYGWAPDQSGCSEQVENSPADDVASTAKSLYLGCQDLRGTGAGSYGGGVIVDRGFGCVQVVAYGHLCQGCVQGA